MRALALAGLLLLGCGGGTGPQGHHDGTNTDLPISSDGTRTDGPILFTDAGPGDSGQADAGMGDTTTSSDLPPSDTSVPDLTQPDLTPPTPDKGTPPTGLSVPCKQGPGWTLFRFHYGGSSTSPQIDVWDASCSYSYVPNSACNVYAVYPGFGSVSYTSQGYPILTSSEYLRVRFSVAGLSFSKAAVYIQARSYATASSTYYEVWSPIYGGLITGPVDNDWVYDWYGLDWSAHLSPLDKPSLTAIQIYANQGSGKLAVKAVELCVQ